MGKETEEKIIEPTLPKGYYRIGYQVFNEKGEYKGIWVGSDVDSITIENCYFAQ